MKTTHYARKVKQVIQKGYVKCLTALCLAMVSTHALADSGAAGIIPISSNDEASTTKDFAQIIIDLFQREIIPFIEIAGGIWIVWTCISTMANGIKDAQEKQKFDPLKNAVIKTAIVVVVGGGLLYILDYIRVQQFGS